MKARQVLATCSSLLLCTSALGQSPPVQPAQAGAAPEEAETEPSIFTDPTDGGFDITAWLLQQSGVIPIPVIITEPALGGFGLGMGVAVLHGTRNQIEDPWTTDLAGERVLPPSISFGFGGYTANDSWFAGAGHFGSWREDSIRYTGLLGYAHVNLDYYVGGNGFGYQIDGAFLMQDLLFRVADTPLFLGGRYTLIANEVELREGGGGILPDELESTNASIGVEALYDTRDSIFTPDTGWQVQLTGSSHNEAFGGDFNYLAGLLDTRFWQPVREDFVLGLRAKGEVAGEDAPFYSQPFIDLRGVPAMRYQGNQVYTLDSELRYDFTPRWSAVGFLGVGGADSSRELRPDYDGIVAGGAGFRYLVGRPIGARAGIDIGVGPEGPALYIQFGSAW